jgi:hypothetical protein
VVEARAPASAWPAPTAGAMNGETGRSADGEVEVPMDEAVAV